MDYNLKIIIDGVTVNEYIPPADETDVEIDTTPSITNVKLKDSTSLNGLDIGSCASNSLYLTMLNPFKESFDGSRVEFFISPQSDPEGTADDIADEIGEDVDTSTEIEEDTDILDTDIDVAEEEGEPLTPEEEAMAEAELAEMNASQYEAFEGEEVPIDAPVDTDEGEEDEWLSMGVYYVVGQTQIEKGIALTCLDGFSQMAGEFEPTNRKATLPAFCLDLKNQLYANCGIVMDDLEITEEGYPEVLDFKYPMTYRQAIGYVAGKLGGFATFAFDETVGIELYSTSSRILMESDMVSYSDNSAGAQTITGAICNRAFNPYKKDEIMVGDGVGIYFNNPFVTQEELEDIFANFKGISYSGAKFTTLWENNIFAGEFVRIMTDDEYAQYVGMQNAIEQGEGDVDELKVLLMQLGKTVLITNQTIDFTGVALTTVDSVLEPTQKTEATPATPTDGKFRALYAEMIAAEYIDAKKVVTDALEAKDAEIQDLVAENLQVESINGNVIKESTILAKALSNEAIQTLGGSKVFYQAEEPTDAKAGDSWYKTVVPADYTGKILFVYDGTNWVGKDLDAKLLQANTITSQEIASNTITANNINMNDLQTNIARIGDANGRHVAIDSDSVDVMNGDDVVASFGETATIGDPNGLSIVINSNRFELGYDANHPQGDMLHKMRLMEVEGQTRSGLQHYIYNVYETYSTSGGITWHTDPFVFHVLEIDRIIDKNGASVTNYSLVGDNLVEFKTKPEVPLRMYYTQVSSSISTIGILDANDGFFSGANSSIEGNLYVDKRITTSNIRIDGHNSDIGYFASEAVKSGTSLNTTMKSVCSIELSKGNWIVFARCLINSTVTSAKTMRCNLHRTSGQNYYMNTNYSPSGQYLRTSFGTIFSITGEKETIHLNAMVSTGSDALSTDSGIYAIRIH